ncbi:SDR family NAD(P)-dependent oxidoreductase [Desulforhopalus sp. 52FAK]
MTLQGKTALIPGAAQVIGRTIAKKFGEMKATLILPVFDWPESIEDMKEEFTSLGYTFHIISADLRSKDGVLSVVNRIKQTTGRLDYLINNIERGGMPIVHGSYDHAHNEGQWELEIETTLRGKWLLYHHCKDLLTKSSDGAVLNISSISGSTGRSGPASVFFNDGYSAANRAVDSLTEQWARECAPHTRVNGLILGLIEGRHGEGTRGWAELSENQKKQLHDHILLGRTGKAKEVAEAVYYLSVQASYMTGSIVKMDGGFSLGSNKVPTMPPGIL